MKTIFLDIDYSELAYENNFSDNDDESAFAILFKNHDIEITRTIDYFIQTPIYRLTADETVLRDWILTFYDDTSADYITIDNRPVLETYLNQTTPESITHPLTWPK